LDGYEVPRLVELADGRVVDFETNRSEIFAQKERLHLSAAKLSWEQKIAIVAGMQEVVEKTRPIREMNKAK